ncbi:MAG: cytochrome b/b6 domain-containing protein [Pseudobdellovibrionaceae bacterium]
MIDNVSFPQPEQTHLEKSPRVLVWDILVRIFHWTVVAGFALEMFVLDEGKWQHRWVGYVILSAILIRILWGFGGTTHARYADWFPTPKKLYIYISSLLKGNEPRYIGHNPAGAVMMIALILAMTACGITGWMQGLDRFWGEEWIQETHEVLANSILVLAGIHVLGAIVESFRHKENLILSMITGYKRAAKGRDIDYADTSDRR